MLTFCCCPSSITFKTVNHIHLINTKTSPETWWYNSKYDTFFRDVPSEWVREKFHHFSQIIKMEFISFAKEEKKALTLLINVEITNLIIVYFHMFVWKIGIKSWLKERNSWIFLQLLHWKSIKKYKYNFKGDIFITMLYFIKTIIINLRD